MFVVIKAERWQDEFSLFLSSGRASSPAFSPDGNRPIVSDGTHAVFIWHLPSIAAELRAIGL